MSAEVSGPPDADDGRKVLLLNPRGFCAGVVRAIQAVEAALERYGPPVYVRRPIVHNIAVLERLEKKGAIFIQELEDAPDGSVVLLSAHGVSKAIKQAAAHRPLRMIDATCPLVSKVHQEVVRHRQAGRHVVLIGHAGHPEIIGTIGQLPPGAITLVSSVADVDALDIPANAMLAYAAQTTFGVDECRPIVAALQRRFADVVGPNSSDICYATTNRQAAVAQVAPQCDHVIVVGDTISSNATRLVELAKASGAPSAQMVADGDGIDFSLFDAAQTIAVTASASTPEQSVVSVLDRLASLWGGIVVEVDGRKELAQFKPANVAAARSAQTPLKPRLAQVGRDVDDFLVQLLPAAHGGKGRLTEAMRYAAVGGGKRLRAMLTIATGEVFGGCYDSLLRVACAIECVHAQSLTHDDLPAMDDDDIRRGKPTVHRHFDEATAILAGDALLALAFRIVADPETHDDPGVRSRLTLELADAIGVAGLAGGQMMDLYPSAQASADELQECHRGKTGSLIDFSVHAGAILGGASAAQRRVLRDYAAALGSAFQIRDDILDAIGDEELAGKKLGKDNALGRANSVHVLGLENAYAECRRLRADCERLLEQFGERAHLLKEIAEFAVRRNK